jgi:hypothetical protein
MMMILGVISTRFGDASLKDLAVQSEVIGEGSIEKVLAGKQYNRAVRLHKINYEAMMRLHVDAFESSFDDTETENFIEDEKKEIENLKTNLCQEECERLLSSAADKTIENTINKDCKSSGGYILTLAYSHNFAATQRWVLNASRRGVYTTIGRCLGNIFPFGKTWIGS